MEIATYSKASVQTCLKQYQAEINLLSDDIPSLCAFVQNMLIHAYWLDKYQVQVSETTKYSEMQVRAASEIFDLAVSKSQKPIVHGREPKERVVSICRDFSLLLCALLREKNIPARIRCGFASYLTPQHYEDHWLCEYWSAQQSRWIMVDAQLDDLHQKTLKLSFNPVDVPATEFLYAGEAWQLCRQGKLAAESFGILGLNGLPFIKGNLIRDLYALAKVELLAWDSGWGLLKEYMMPIDEQEELQLLDQLAIISKNSDYANAKQMIESHQSIKLPEGWKNQDFPRIEALHAAMQQ